MSKRFSSLIAASSAVAIMSALALAGGANGAGSLPTLTVALTGASGVSVSGSTVSGAVNVVSTFKGKGQGFLGLVRLNPGVSTGQAIAVVHRAHDINALTPYGTLFVSTSAPGVVQTVLTPGNYVAVNTSGNGRPALAPFSVTQSSSPAALPAARATEASFEFGFRGPTVLHDGTIVRARNDGWLVHMNDLTGVRDAATGQAVIALLRAGKDRAAQKLASNTFVSLLGPSSPGALQQQVLQAKPGYYVEGCFENTQDGRAHTQLGMLRLVRVVK